MIFTWDDGKDRKNYEDHAIHLGTAAYVFNDPHRLERPDVSANNNTLEERWQTLGKVKNVIFVVYEERDGDEKRLISARIASPKERRIYNGYGNDGINPWSPAD